MANKKIHCYGDSWTHGIGSELPPGSGVRDIDDKYSNKWYDNRKKYSWPGRLKLYTKFDIRNRGFGGNSNKQIYQDIIDDLYENKINSGDIVIVMWSSIVREPLNFFAIPHDKEGGFLHYNDDVRIQEHGEYGGEIPHWIHNQTNDFKNKLNKATFEVYKEFILNRVNYEFLYEISMNYICNLQIYFSELNIDYMFVNAFELMLDKNHHLYSHIDLSKWLLPHSSMDKFLKSKLDEIDDTLPYSYWEDDFKLDKDEPVGPHPNRIGYELIANKIYEFLRDNKYEI